MLRRQLAELLPLAAVLLLHLSCPTESQWTGAIAYSSFEEPVALATATPITDPLASDADHELLNGAGANPVQYTACTNGQAELGFRSFYVNSAHSPADGPLHAGTARIGVVGDATVLRAGGLERLRVRRARLGRPLGLHRRDGVVLGARGGDQLGGG